jgi:hypothetical protein
MFENRISEELIHVLKSIALSLRRAYPPPEEEKFQTWSQRDQLAWELFKQDVRGIDITDGDPTQAGYNKIISSAYSVADIFLVHCNPNLQRSGFGRGHDR